MCQCVRPMKSIAIVQSNYIPWKGYFDLIASVDEFVLFDDVQYTRRDWRNRNLIKTAQGPRWLTIPVKSKNNYHANIRDMEVADAGWHAAHWSMLVQNYREAMHFADIASWLEPLYASASETHLSAINRRFIEALAGYLRINTTVTDSSTYQLADDRSERLAYICEQAGAHEYVSGPAAQAYLDLTPFTRRNIKVRWFGYEGYQPYPQLHGPFEHAVSVLDVLFNCGPESRRYMTRLP